MITRSIVFLILFAFFTSTIKAQTADEQDIAAVTADSTFKKTPLKGLLPLPAFSYSPETQFTMGLALIYTFELATKDTFSRKSNLRSYLIYTTAKQTILTLEWELFTKNELYYIQGKTFYQKFPDRHYGIGNEAAAVVETLNQANTPLETQNYLPLQTKRLHFSTSALRKLGKTLYMGIDYEFESLYDYKNGFAYSNIKTPEFYQNPVTGKRSGLGLAISYDTRDNIINAYKGHLVELRNRNDSKYLGSDYTFTAIDLDYRTYKRIYKDQVLAFNFVSQSRLAETEERIPIRALARLGGDDLVKGYFYGSYQDRFLLAFQTEYRVPVVSFPNFPVVKGLGLVFMFSGGKTFHAPNDFDLNGIRFSTGGGIRLVFNKEDRVNIGVDYALGLHKQLGKRPSGIYFSIGETF